MFDSLKGINENKEETFTFNNVPTNVEELMNLPEASLDSPYKTAALTLLSLLQFDVDQDACYEMLDFLKGPESISGYEKSFIRDRLTRKGYVVRSYFHGTNPDNNYTPSEPLAVTVKTNAYSFSDHWATVLVQSSGADSPRNIKLRLKPSTGQWFLAEVQCLSDIRAPKSEDKWA